MNVKRFALVTLALLVLVSLVASPTVAELSIVPVDDSSPNLVLMAITDHPDPIDAAAWQVVRAIDDTLLLNPDGFERGDGRPDYVMIPGGSRPAVVWAQASPTGFELAFSQWLGESWSTRELISAEPEHELDPRIAVESDGTTHVVWWVPNLDGISETVYLMSRLPGGAWSAPEPVSLPFERGRRPSVLSFQGNLYVAYESVLGADTQVHDIVVARRENNTGFSYQIVASTPRTQRLDPILHTNGTWIWVDWKHGDGEFGHAVGDGVVWGSWSTTLWTDPSWIGVEATRKQIESSIAP